MLADLRALVNDVAETTGAEPPMLLTPDAPVLSDDALSCGERFYLIGLIGGKDVGKSALVNALVGREITPRTSHGPGTETAIAYAHAAQRRPLQQLLEREAPGRFSIITHDNDQLRSQVLLDLPDIDSHYAAHLELTRRMLRHMLFPIWIQSIEKYADRQPQELLSAVAAGNAPANFLFCLNKVDQLERREGAAAISELAGDYARRLAALLNLDQPPRVWMISAIQADAYDLPELRRRLDRQLASRSVDSSRQLAQRRQGSVLLDWIDARQLPRRRAAIDRLIEQTRDELAARVAGPLLDQAVNGLLDDPAYRLMLVDQLTQQRINRWPIVNVLHIAIATLLLLFRRRLPLDQQDALRGSGPLVRQHLRELHPQRPAALLQATFASLQNSAPLLGEIYGEARPWETRRAELAEAELAEQLAATIQRQEQTIRQRFARTWPFSGLVRTLLTVGALAWFAFIQPLLLAWITDSQALLPLAIELLGVTHLLESLAFLAVYYLVLWLAIRFATQRYVDRQLSRWRRADVEPSLSLAGAALEWTDSLLGPMLRQRNQLTELIERTETLRSADAATRAA